MGSCGGSKTPITVQSALCGSGLLGHQGVRAEAQPQRRWTEILRSEGTKALAANGPTCGQEQAQGHCKAHAGSATTTGEPVCLHQAEARGRVQRACRAFASQASHQARQKAPRHARMQLAALLCLLAASGAAAQPVSSRAKLP